MIFIVAGIVVLGALGLLYAAFVKTVVVPLERVRRVMEAISDGDGSARLGTYGTREIGALGQALDTMLDTLDARGADLERAGAAREEQLQATSAQQRRAQQEVRRRAQALVSGTSEAVVGDLHDVMDQVGAVRSAAGTIDERVAAADGVVRDVVEKAREADRVVDALSESLRKVGGIARLIGGVAKQTDLLALNATIEAARAGEAGRGFAVVAGEVKTLATTTAQSTAEITSIVSALERDAAAVADTMRAVTDRVSVIDDATAELSNVARQQRTTVDLLGRSVQETIGRIESLAQMTEGIERRAADRAPATGIAELRAAGRTWTATMIDLSATGMRCRIDRSVQVAVGDTVEVDLPLGDDRLTVEATVMARRAGPDGEHLGLQFERVGAEAGDRIYVHVERLLGDVKIVGASA